MSNAPPWMPFYPADFDADTRHLSPIETGAYIRLICHYWLKGGLPTEDERLARIAGMDLEHWQSICSALETLFQPNWRHKRIEYERDKAAKIRAKRVDAGIKSWGTQANRIHANAVRKHKQKQSKCPDNYNHIKEVSYDLTLGGDDKGSPKDAKRLGRLSDEAMRKIGIVPQ